MTSDVNIAEIPYPSGRIKYRYTRYLAPSGDKWIRHGLFVGYYENGNIQTEGSYDHGTEEGVWRDYHENGRLAAQGTYEGGKEVGEWKYWAADGTFEGSEWKNVRS